MSILLIGFLLLLNFGISWWNAYVTGKVWVETRALGGWGRVLAWCGAIQSAAGFTMVYSITLGALAFAFHLLSAHAFAALSGLTYLMIIFPILGSGIIITIQSWITAYKERSFSSMGVAGWNTFAMASNTYDAADGGVSSALGEVAKFFKSDDDEDEDEPAKMLVVLIVIFALGAGILTTYSIMRSAMGTLPRPVRATA